MKTPIEGVWPAQVMGNFQCRPITVNEQLIDAVDDEIFFVESYLAFSIPAILAGYFVGKIGLMSTANSYICFIILLSFVALLLIFKNFKSK